jgi:hypothetical protein
VSHKSHFRPCADSAPATGKRTIPHGAGTAGEPRTPRARAPVRGPRQRAAEFLLLALATGPRTVRELQRLASDRGVSWRMVERIRRDLGVISERVRGQAYGWAWRIHPDEPSRARRRADRALLAFLLRVAHANGVETWGLGSNPSAEAVVALLAEELGPETLRGWITELSAREPHS